MHKALVIPVDGPLYEIDLGASDARDLDTMQQVVGGYIEGVPIPRFVPGHEQAYAFINEEGKYDPGCLPNRRATDFMVPGAHLAASDYIAGPMILTGRDDHGGTAELPQGVVARARLIEREAGR